jgi:hypothetical protein
MNEWGRADDQSIPAKATAYAKGLWWCRRRAENINPSNERMACWIFYLSTKTNGKPLG